MFNVRRLNSFDDLTQDKVLIGFFWLFFLDIDGSDIRQIQTAGK